MTKIGTDIDRAISVLDGNGLVAIPTETVYGLAANALSEEAVIKIFEAKQRPSFDPLICHVDKLDSLDTIVRDFPEEAHKLASHFWPGPLTLLLPKSDLVPDIVTSGLDTVAVRVPKHNWTEKLLSKLSYPLAAPSANPFGYISPTSAQHVADQLQDKVDYIIDGGSSVVGVESTIISFESQKLKVHRLGGLSIEQIEDVAAVKAELSLNNSSNPAAPGMLKSHYAPKVPLYIGNIDELSVKYSSKRIGVLSFENDINVECIKHLVLSETGDLNEAAKNLFSALRTMDYASIDVILTEFVPDQGLGRAINDRLKRASVKI